MFDFLKKKNVDPKAALQQTLGEYQLPSFPNVVMDVLEKMRDPEASAGEVADVISGDPNLSVKVLKIVNSAAFARASTVENLKQAVALIGFSQLEQLVLSAAVSDALPSPAVAPFDAATFWQASARRGILARNVARKACPAKESECFTAGLLQDMAVPFLVQQHAGTYAAILTQWAEGDADLPELERSAHEWDHAEVASWICDAWQIPENIAEAIAGHHGTDSGLACPEPVRLVSRLKGVDDDTQVLAEALQNEFGHSPEAADDLVQTSFEAADELANLIA